MLQEGAVEVSMSSSENSQDMAWYKGEFEISNKMQQKILLIYVLQMILVKQQLL